MKFLIAGLGSIGRRHLRNLVALGEKDILLYRTHQSTLPEDELAGFPVETELRAALNQGPDAVIVANPTALHLSVAIPAARQGCHLLLEKPVAESMEGMADLVAAVKEGGGQVLVGYQFRFHPGLIQAARSPLPWRDWLPSLLSGCVRRIPSGDASLGGLPAELQRSPRPGRRCHPDTMSPAGLCPLATRRLCWGVGFYWRA